MSRQSFHGNPIFIFKTGTFKGITRDHFKIELNVRIGPFTDVTKFIQVQHAFTKRNLTQMKSIFISLRSPCL
jgi:hypothetical protein